MNSWNSNNPAFSGALAQTNPPFYPSAASPPLAHAAPRPQQPPVQQTFLGALSSFLASQGNPIRSLPAIDGQPVDLNRLFTVVRGLGGGQNVVQTDKWSTVAAAMAVPFDSQSQNGPAHSPARLQQLAQIYTQYLAAFEMMHIRSMQQRMNQQNQGSAAPPSQPYINPNAPAFNQQRRAAVQMDRPPPNVPYQSPQLANAQPPNYQSPASFNSLPPPIAPQPLRQSPLPNHAQINSYQANLPPPQPTPATAPVRLPDPILPAPQPYLNGDLKGKQKASEPIRPPSPVKPRPKSPKIVYVDKRQKVEYMPISRELDSIGPFDVASVDAYATTLSIKKRKRGPADLGQYDVHSVTMSLRSRIPTEIVFALNSLTIISGNMKTSDQEQGIYFPLEQCPDLYDELLSVLQDTFTGVEADEEDNWIEDDIAEATTPKKSTLPKGKSKADPRPMRPRSYSEHLALAAEQELDLASNDPPNPAILGRAETILSILNILRNFSLTDYNHNFIATRTKAFDLLLRLCDLDCCPIPPPSEGQDWIEWSCRDVLAVRKEVLIILGNIGLCIGVHKYAREIIAALFELCYFFLNEPAASQHPSLEVATVHPKIPLPKIQPAPVKSIVGHYSEIALNTFNKLVLRDRDRDAVAAVVRSCDLADIFKALIQLLPQDDESVTILTREDGLILIESLLMSLYTITFISPTSLRNQWVKSPGYLKSIFRIAKRTFHATTHTWQTNPYAVICDRCFELLALLANEDRGEEIVDPDQPWFGYRDDNAAVKVEKKSSAGILADVTPDLLDMLAKSYTEKDSFEKLQSFIMQQR